MVVFLNAIGAAKVAALSASAVAPGAPHAYLPARLAAAPVPTASANL